MKYKFLTLCLLVVFSVVAFAQQPSGTQTQETPRPAAPIVTSILEVYDLATGTRRVVREFPNTRMEAPNWTPDGKWLVYNSGGLLYKVSPDIIDDTPVQINTDFVNTANNDHVISADGKFIALSASAVEDRRSRIYTVPIEGGIPQLITPVGPSWLHGISPDNKYLLYYGERNGNHSIFIIPTQGGKEIRLTDENTDLDDGPEYSPDGKYIWFNSVRTGLMQVWRMKADGSEQTQITFHEDRLSWFPHVSPDGKQVVYITYKVGDQLPHQHVANRNVDLRLMTIDGKDSKVIAELFGGQGTINVNSWAPDSKRFAFVSYRLEEQPAR